METVHEDVKKELSNLELHLLKSHELMTIRGRRVSLVPVLLPADIQQLMKYLANFQVRQAARLQSSLYFFASQGVNS